MPELPEVETIRKGLINLVGGAVIIDVAVFWDRMITPPFSGGSRSTPSNAAASI